MSDSVLTVEITDRRSGHRETRELGDWQDRMVPGVTIGSDPSCEVFLEGPGVAPQHARYYARGHHQLVDELTEGHFVEPPATPRVLWQGMRIDRLPMEVGPYTIQFGSAPKPVETAEEGRAILADRLDSVGAPSWRELADALRASTASDDPRRIVRAVQHAVIELALAFVRRDLHHVPAPLGDGVVSPAAYCAAAPRLCELLAAAQPEKLSWGKRPARVIETAAIVCGGDTDRAGWGNIRYDLKQLLRHALTIEPGLAHDAAIMLTGRALAGPYAELGCALWPAGSGRWGVALRVGGEVLVRVDTLDEALATVADAHVEAAVRAVGRA